MEILKHHLDRFKEIAKRAGTPDVLAREEAEKLRRINSSFYRLDSPENYRRRVYAYREVIYAIREGQVREVPDFGSGLDIICRNCAAKCEVKDRALNSTRMKVPAPVFVAKAS